LQSTTDMRRLLVLATLFALPFLARPQATLITHTAAGCSVNCGTTGGGTPVTTSAIDTTGAGTHNLILICATGSSGNTPAALQPTDNCGNTYTLLNSQNEDGDSRVAAYYVIGGSLCSSHTFTFNGHAPAGAVMVFSGIASGPDQQSQSVGATPLTAGSVTPTNADEVVTACSSYFASATSSMNITEVDSVDYDGGYNGSLGTVSGYQIQTTPTAVNPTLTLTPARSAAIVANTFYSTQAPATLAITTTNFAEGFVGTAYSAAASIYPVCLTAVGGIGPYTWSILSGTSPSGLTFGSNGCWSGTPSAAGGPSITYQITDSASTTANATLPITISATAFSAGAGTCTGTALNGTQDAVFGGCSMSASGGSGGYSFIYANISTHASIPPGLSLNTSTGELSGTNYGEGRYVTPFTISDSLGTYANVSLTFNLAGDNSMGGCTLFPSNSIFHARVDSLPVDTSVAAPIDSAYTSTHINLGFGPTTSGAGYTPNGIPILTVPATTSSITATTVWNGSYSAPNMFSPNSLTSPCLTTSSANCVSSAPIPLYNPVEDTAGYNGTGQDQHTSTVIEAGNGHNCQLAEQYQGQAGTTTWQDHAGAFWSDLTSNQMPKLSDGGTTDAAGLPLAPVLENYDEVANAISTGTIPPHAIRFTLNHMLARYVWPATATAGTGSCSGGYVGGTDDNQIMQANPPASCTFSGPAGEIYRITASAYASPPNSCLTNTSTNPEAAVIWQQMREYGIILADNGTTGQIIGTPDSRWNSTDLSCLTNIPLSDFEPVNVSSLIPSANLPAGCPGTNGDCVTLSSYQAAQQASPPSSLAGATVSGGTIQ
jgi:hypothetical protein